MAIRVYLYGIEHETILNYVGKCLKQTKCTSLIDKKGGRAKGHHSGLNIMEVSVIYYTFISTLSEGE